MNLLQIHCQHSHQQMRPIFFKKRKMYQKMLVKKEYRMRKMFCGAIWQISVGLFDRAYKKVDNFFI